MKKTDRKRKKLLLAGCAAGVLLLGGTAAYLTDYDQTVNEFTVGQVKIELSEDHWKPEDNIHITPCDVIAKDPKITNTGINDAYVYIQVSIPKEEVITADAEGRRETLANRELFTFEKNDGWELIGTEEKEDEKIYTYTYDSILSAGETTGTLFDQVVFLNVIEGQLDTREFRIPVKSYAIQAANTTGDAADHITKAKTAFEKYVNQNTSSDGSILE